VQQMSAVAGDAGEQTLISISTDAVERPRSVIRRCYCCLPITQLWTVHRLHVRFPQPIL